MQGIALVLSNTPKAIYGRMQMIRIGIEQAAKASKIKRSFVVPKYELPEQLKNI